MAVIRLRHPDLDFWADVDLREFGTGKWVAMADFASEPDVGIGRDPGEAVRAALSDPGEPYASEMAASAELP